MNSLKRAAPIGRLATVESDLMTVPPADELDVEAPDPGQNLP